MVPGNSCPFQLYLDILISLSYLHEHTDEHNANCENPLRAAMRRRGWTMRRRPSHSLIEGSQEARMQAVPVTAELARRAAALAWRDLPDDLVERTKQCLIDWFAV